MDLPTEPPVTASNECKAVPGKIEQSCTSDTSGLNYWLYLPPKQTVPENQDETKQQKPPLLIYLHGFNHSGSDLNYLLAGGLPEQLEDQRALPMIVVSPQCPQGENWQLENMVERLSHFTAEITTQYGADPRRVYLTGFSMGGDGVWALGSAHPEQFAALAPVGSWYSDEKAVCSLKNVPVWDFQGEQDQIVSPAYAKKMSAALEKCGGTVKLTLFPDADHQGSSKQAYGMDALYSWLLEQQQK